LISLFIVLARVHLAEGATQPAFGGPAVLPLAAILAMLNLGYLAIHLTRGDAWMSSYRELVARIPRSATVLPIYTSRQEGAVAPRLHSSSYIVMDRVALIPYLFSGDAGAPVLQYFRYKSRPYAPIERWYSVIDPGAVDWHTVACSYDSLLVGKPYDSKRIFVRNSTVAENSSAALLKVDAGGTENGCARRQLP